MKFLMVAALMTTGVLKAERMDHDMPVVMVCQQGFTEDPLFQEARGVASMVMQSIGIKLKWRGEQDCLRSTSSILITVATNSLAEDNPGALAYARVYEEVESWCSVTALCAQLQVDALPWCLGM